MGDTSPKIEEEEEEEEGGLSLSVCVPLSSPEPILVFRSFDHLYQVNLEPHHTRHTNSLVFWVRLPCPCPCLSVCFLLTAPCNLFLGSVDWFVACVGSSWIFSVGAALISIPVGIRRKSLAPLVFFGSTGCMLDIILSVSNCEREFQQKQQAILEQQQHDSDAL